MSSKRPLVPNPCHEDWDKLTPEERGHFCTVCETKVWDLSSLTREEAAEFLHDTEGDLCVSYWERQNGEVIHREAPVVPLSRLVRRLPAAAGFSLALAACTPTGQAPETEGANEQPQSEPAEPEPTPEPEPDDEQKPPEEKPPPVDDPGEKHVKGKWVAEDPPVEGKGPKPHIKKGKVARPD